MFLSPSFLFGVDFPKKRSGNVQIFKQQWTFHLITSLVFCQEALILAKFLLALDKIRALLYAGTTCSFQKPQTEEGFMAKGDEDTPPAGQGITDDDIDGLFSEGASEHPDADFEDMQRHATKNPHNRGEKIMPTTQDDLKFANANIREETGKALDKLSERLRIGRVVQEMLDNPAAAAAVMFAGTVISFDVKRINSTTDEVIHEVLEFYSSIRPHVSFAVEETNSDSTHYVVEMTVRTMNEVVVATTNAQNAAVAIPVQTTSDDGGYPYEEGPAAHNEGGGATSAGG